MYNTPKSVQAKFVLFGFIDQEKRIACSLIHICPW